MILWDWKMNKTDIKFKIYEDISFVDYLFSFILFLNEIKIKRNYRIPSTVPRTLAQGIIRVVICGCTLKGAAEKDEETQPIAELSSVFYLVLFVYTCCYRSVWSSCNNLKQWFHLGEGQSCTFIYEKGPFGGRKKLRNHWYLYVHVLTTIF